jgi:hypothetical protein
VDDAIAATVATIEATALAKSALAAVLLSGERRVAFVDGEAA